MTWFLLGQAQSYEDKNSQNYSKTNGCYELIHTEMHVQFHGDVTQSMQFSTGYSSRDSLKKTAENQGMGLIIEQCTS